MNRRGFLGSILALGAAPAIVKASSLMKVPAPVGRESAVLDLLVRRMKEAGDMFEDPLANEVFGHPSGFYDSKVAHELNEIVRRAFVPKLAESIYNTGPLTQKLVNGNGRRLGLDVLSCR